MDATTIPGFTQHNMDDPAVPVLLSVPHAGRDYPEAILANLRLPRASLLRLEDRYADLLARGPIAANTPTIIAHRARSWIDLNRDERDIDVEMIAGLNRQDYPAPSVKQRGGLGLIPRRLSGEGDIWRGPFDAADVQARVSSYHRIYHAAVAGALSRMRVKFGIAILLDLHSMPPINAVGPEPAPRFVIGDRFGASSSSRYAHLLTDHFSAQGYAVALNHPYSGDYMLRRHASVNRNIHALQLEVDRSLYLDSELREPGGGIIGISELLCALVTILANEAEGNQLPIAAE